jgi:hypothetical protein
MRVTGPLDSIARGGIKTFAAAPRAIEKSSPSSHLGGQTPEFSQPGQKSPPRLQVELVYQDETQAFDPFWDGPRLLPSFVAQLMGQVIPERREANVCVETAYGTAVPRQALLVDRKS